MNGPPRVDVDMRRGGGFGGQGHVDH